MDAFLSYNRADAAAVATLDAWLSHQGLRCFLDTRELRSGELWLPELERAITGEASAMLVLVGPSGLGNTQHYEYQLGLTRQAAEPGFPLIPVLLPGTPEYRFPRGFLGLQTWVSFAEGLNDPIAQQRLLTAIRREPLDAEAVRGAICPYKGLEAFQEEDGKIFFGRDVEAAQLHRTVIEHGVAAVIGRSGSGKSSLARAGLLPRLRQKSEGHWGVVWDRLVLRPGRYPLSALAEALEPPQAPPNSVEYGAALRRTADVLRGQKPDFVAELLHRRLAGLERRTDRFLILLDQAEEMFARPIELTDAQAIRDWQADTEKLIALLLGAAQRGPASLVLTIRSDFFDPLQHSPMGPLLNKAMVATRGVQDLRAAVAGPAGLVGLRFSPGLEDRILRETGEDEGNLPLLQHALKRSWELREGGVITSTAYDRAGGVEQAINLAAQSAFDSLGSEGQAAAKRLFLRLVRPGEGRGHVRVRAPLPEDPAQRVVAEFFGAPERRLLFFGHVDGRNTVEVAHEALIRGWPKLIDWVEENRERLAARDAVRDWIAGSGGELLPSGALLARGRALLVDPGDVAVEDIAPLIQASDAAVGLASEERAKLAARIAGLAAERKAAGYRMGLFGFAAVSLVLLIVTGALVAMQMKDHATEMARGDAATANEGFDAVHDITERLIFDLVRRLRRDGTRATEFSHEVLNISDRALNSMMERSPNHQRTLYLRARAFREFALTYDVIGDTKLQRDAAEQALTMFRRLLRDVPGNQAWQQGLASSYLRFGDALRNQGDFAGSLAAYRASFEIIGRLASAHQGSPEWRRDLAATHTRIGDAFQDEGNSDAALTAYQHGFEVIERLAAANPGDPEWQRDLALLHYRIGDAWRGKKDRDRALNAYQNSRAILESLATITRRHAQWLLDLSDVHNRIGDTLLELQDGAGAEAAYREGFAMIEQLAATDPENAGWQRDLALSHNRIGHVLRDQGDALGAREHYGAGMAIIARLVERQPGHAEWQRDLLLSRWLLGDLHLRFQEPMEARLHAEAALTLARARSSRFPDQARSASDLNVAYNLLRSIEAATP